MLKDMILRKTLLKNRLMILSGLFLVLLVSFGVASFSVDVTNLTFGGSTFEHGDSDSVSLTLTNDYENYSIGTINFIFNPNSSLSGNPITSSNFVENIPDDLLNKSVNVSSITLAIPAGMDAIDEDFNEVSWNVGEVNISGNATNLTNMTVPSFLVSEIIPVTVQVENNLEFYSGEVEVEIDGEDADNISDGNTVTAYVGDDVDIVVSYKNTFSNDSFEFNDKDVKVVIYVDDAEKDYSVGDDDVKGGEVGVARKVVLDLSDYDVDEYDIKLELSGKIDGGLHGEIFEFKLDVKEEPADTPLDSDGDGVNDDVDACPTDHVPGCIVEVDGCDLDSDGDGMCDGWDKTPNGTEKEEEKKEEVLETANSDEEQEEETEKEIKDEEPKETPWPFVFGLIVGVVGAALFFVLTKF